MNTDKKQVVASVGLRDPSGWGKRGRKNIADWLRACADDLEKNGATFAKYFRYRYFPKISKWKGKK